MDAPRLRRLLGGCVPLVYEDVTGSTNDDAKALISRGEVPVLVVAGRQIAGRGRRGNTFLSPEGGIYMSLAIPVPGGSHELLTLFAGVCVCEALEATHGLWAGIKWVNDIYVDGRKLAGILVERTGPHVVVGVGINGHVAPELDGGVGATALAEHVESPDLERLCADVAIRLVVVMQEVADSKATVAACARRSVLLGHEVSFRAGAQARRGKAVGIDDDGALLVQTPDGLERLTGAACDVRHIDQ